MNMSTRANVARETSFDPTRRAALVAGVLYLITFASSIPAVFLLGPVLNNANFIVSAGGADSVRLGSLFDIVNCLTAIGTAVALYAVVKRQHQGFAIGFVSSRIFEASVLMIATVSVLAIVTLQKPGATGSEASLLVTVQQTLVAVRDWSFALGTGVPALNAALLGWLMYQSRLVPRAIPVLGLIGAPLFTSWIVGYILGITDGGSAWHAIAVAPIFFWELSVGLWMAFKGFNRNAPIVIQAMAEASDRVAAGTPARSAVGMTTEAGAA